MSKLTRVLALLVLVSHANAATAQVETPQAPASTDLQDGIGPLARPVLPADMQGGVEIYRQFRDGLADPSCQPQASDAQWQKHFSRAPARLADRQDDILPLFGYVVGAMRDAGLPTEFALIPFVESGYHPAASNKGGPSGLWQFVSLTARNHGVRVRSEYDGRLSPVDSTQAAVRYLKTLHGLFGGDWRLAVMGYNAGENRMLQAVRRAGGNVRDIDPSRLQGLSRTTYAYVQKLHALACTLEQAGDRPEWLAGLDRPVPRLQPLQLPPDFGSLSAWARSEGHDADQLAGLNPALNRLRSAPSGGPLWVLAPAPEGTAAAITASDLIAAHDPSDGATRGDDATSIDRPAQATYVVRAGDTLSTIARRHGLRAAQLQQWNELGARAVIKPGLRLRLEARPP